MWAHRNFRGFCFQAHEGTFDVNGLIGYVYCKSLLWSKINVISSASWLILFLYNLLAIEQDLTADTPTLHQ